MLAAARGVPAVDAHDLYGSYADYAIDVPAEQARLAAALAGGADASGAGFMPALLAVAGDVLTYGWAYGPGGAACTARDLWLVATTGGPGVRDSYHPQSYNRYFFGCVPAAVRADHRCVVRHAVPAAAILHGAHRAADVERGPVATFADRPERVPRIGPRWTRWPPAVAWGVIPQNDRPDTEG